MGDFSAEFLSSKNVETFLKNLIKFIEEQGMKNKLVELVNISKSFGSTKVLDELCLEVKENEFLTLLDRQVVERQQHYGLLVGLRDRTVERYCLMEQILRTFRQIKET